MPEEIIKDELKPIDGEQPAYPPRRRWLRCGCLTVLVLLVFGYLAFNIGVHYYFQFTLRMESGPEEYAHMQKFLREPFSFTPGEYDPPPQTGAMKKALEEVKRTLAEAGKKGVLKSGAELIAFEEPLRQNGTLTEEQWNQARELLNGIQPFIDALFETSSQIERDLQIIRDTPGEQGDGAYPHFPVDYHHDYLAMNVFNLRIHLLLHEDRFDEALKQDLASLFLLVRTPMAYVDNLYSLRYKQSEIVKRIAALVSMGMDREQQQAALEALNLLAPHLCKGIMDRSLEYSVMMVLQRIEKRGTPVDMKPDHPGAFYVDRIVDAEYETVPVGTVLRFVWEYILVGNAGRNMRMIQNDFVRSFTFLKSIERDPFLRYLAQNNRALSSEWEMKRQLDILRLTIAGELYKKDTGAFPTATADLVPEYIPEDIRNAATGEPYEWSGVGMGP